MRVVFNGHILSFGVAGVCCFALPKRCKRAGYMLHNEKLPVLYTGRRELMLHSEMKGSYDGMGACLESKILNFVEGFAGVNQE